jgi:hypothetical protein
MTCHSALGSAETIPFRHGFRNGVGRSSTSTDPYAARFMPCRSNRRRTRCLRAAVPGKRAIRCLGCTDERLLCTRVTDGHSARARLRIAGLVLNAETDPPRVRIFGHAPPGQTHAMTRRPDPDDHRCHAAKRAESGTMVGEICCWMGSSGRYSCSQISSRLFRNFRLRYREALRIRYSTPAHIGRTPTERNMILFCHGNL